MKELLSIIVPVYNTKDYLRRCIDSLLNQSYKNLEIIVIDDGSEKSTADLCDSIAKSSPIIRVVHKDNNGLSSARNRGLEEAAGDFITFVDSDDYIADLQTYENCIRILNETEADVVQFPYQETFSTYCREAYTPNKTIKYSSIKEFIDNFRAANKWESGTITSSSCDKVYRKEIINDIRFVNMFLEDVAFITDLFERIRNIVVQEKGLYAYCIRENSLMTSKPNYKKSSDAIKADILVYNSLRRNSNNYLLQNKQFIKIIKNINNLYIQYGDIASVLEEASTMQLPVRIKGTFYDRFRIILIHVIGIRAYVNLCYKTRQLILKF